ncbi:acyl-CoA dehydrogenase family protein [Rhodoferax ferrireducens]|uniref:acyl-CoA dehydrogenase family protein n=1 Tax=Rhodoferax ferrireducens TaxID=192843 RepID=UPI000E0D9834|nr:acyl-CoA dehydrogenase family protein [Rhodoferax ferrireducens]
MIRDSDPPSLLLDTLARFVREKRVPHEACVGETDQIPKTIVRDMKELGLFGVSTPEAHGGMGLTMEVKVMAGFEVARQIQQLVIARSLMPGPLFDH